MKVEEVEVKSGEKQLNLERRERYFLKLSFSRTTTNFKDKMLDVILNLILDLFILFSFLCSLFFVPKDVSKKFQ